MNNLEIEKRTGTYGLTATLGYDPYSESSPPKRHPDWQLISNRREARSVELDGTYDRERFYGDEDLTEWFRDSYDAHLMVRIRYESHGPYGAFRIDEKFGPGESVTKAWYHEAIAVITKEGADTLGGPEQAYKALEQDLEVLSDWAHGQVYRYTVTDHRGKVVDTEGLIYGFEFARDKMEQALEEAEGEAEQELRESNEWAARDVFTVNAVPGAIGASQ